MQFKLPEKFSDSRNDVVAVDIGQRTTKVVYLCRRQGAKVLKDYFMFDSPSFEGLPDEETLTDQLRQIREKIPSTVKNIVITLSAAYGWLSHAELPSSDPATLRLLLKSNSKKFLQNDLSNHIFDCRPTARTASQHEILQKVDPVQAAKKPSRTANYLVNALKVHFVNDLKSAVSKSGFKLRSVCPGQVSTVNSCLNVINPQENPAVAILDIGFAHTTINILLNGEFILTRTVNTGGDKFTGGLAEMMNINYPAAEGIKLVMPDKVQAKLKVPVSEVGTELRASIDFFENLYDIHVSRILLVGGSARSNFIVSTLEEGLHVLCERWLATQTIELELSEEKAALLEKDGPQLSTAIGAGMTFFDPSLIPLNILSEEIEAEERRRKDPVRRAKLISAGVFGLVGLWVALIVAQMVIVQGRLAILNRSLSNLKKETAEVTRLSKLAGDVERQHKSLYQISRERFLWADTLNAVQQVADPEIEFLSLEQVQNVYVTEIQPTVDEVAAARRTGEKPVVKTTYTESMILRIQAKDLGDPEQKSGVLIDNIIKSPYFSSVLNEVEPVLITDLGSPQVDLVNMNRSFVLFTIECYFKENVQKNY